MSHHRSKTSRPGPESLETSPEAAASAQADRLSPATPLALPWLVWAVLGAIALGVYFLILGIMVPGEQQGNDRSNVFFFSFMPLLLSGAALALLQKIIHPGQVTRLAWAALEALVLALGVSVLILAPSNESLKDIYLVLAVTLGPVLLVALGLMIGQIFTPASESIPAPLWAALAGLMASLLPIMLALTSLTHNLDDIKISLFYFLGPMLVLLSSLIVARGIAPFPTRHVCWGLLAYGAVTIVSTLCSEYKWEGWWNIVFIWSSVGFFLIAVCIGSHRAASRFFLNFLVLLLLATNLVGFFFYDLAGSPAHPWGIAWVHKLLYHGEENHTGALFNLMITLASEEARNVMQSTILNREFYAGFCALLLPFAALLGLDPGSGRRVFWRSIGILTTLLSILSIFLCQSKGEYVFAAIASTFLVVMFLLVGLPQGMHRRHLIAWLAGFLLILLTVGWMRSPSLMFMLKSVSISAGSRAIIWKGAWGIFQKFHYLGGGPGTFGIYFPLYRSPDYMYHAISNVTTFSHNYFLDLLSETGLPGLLSFVFLLGALCLPGLRQAFKSPDHNLRVWLTAALAAMVAIYGGNLTNPDARWVIGATPLWTVMGFLAGLLRQAEGWTPAAGPVRPPAATPKHKPASWKESWRGPLAAAGTLGVFALFMWPLATNESIHYFKSAVLYAQGNNYMEFAMKKNETHEMDLQNVGHYLDLSATLFEESLLLSPTNLSAYYHLGSVYTTRSQIDAQAAEDALRQGENQKGLDFSASGDENLKKAKNTYEKLMHYAPDYAEIHYNMGIVYNAYASYLRRNASRLAAGELSAEYVGKGPKTIEALIGQYEQKASDHLRIMGKMSDKPEVAMQLGSQYEMMGRFKEARDVFRKASANHPEDDKLAGKYCQAAMQLKDYPGVGEALERLWQLAPANESILDQLLEVAEDHGLEALLRRVIERLEHINPINPRLYEARMNLAQRQGKTAQVLEAAQNYVRCGGQDPEIYQMGALSAQTLGHKDQVKEFYKLIQHVDRDAKTTYGLEARRRLAALQANTATLATQFPAVTDRATSPSGNPSNKADARPQSSAAGSAPR